MEQAVLLPLMGNHQAAQVNIKAGNKGTKIPFSFLQVIEALINLDLNASGTVSGTADDEPLAQTASSEQEENELLTFFVQEISNSQLPPGEAMESINAVKTDGLTNQELAGKLHMLLSSLKKDISDSSEIISQGELREDSLFKTLFGKMDLQNVQQWIMTDTIQENMLTHTMQECAEQTQGVSVFVDPLVTAEAVLSDTGVKAEAQLPDTAVKAEIVLPDPTELESLMAQKADPEITTEKSAAAEQGKLIELFSSEQKGEQSVTAQTQESPAGVKKEKTIINEQLGYLTTKPGSAAPETVIGRQKNDLSFSKEILPDKTAEFIVKQVIDKAELFVGKERADLKLKLNPDFLGHLKLIISVEKGIVHAHFIAENQITAALIEGQMQSLRQSLEQQGITWQQISVAVDGRGQDAFLNKNGSGAYESSQGQEYTGRDFSPDEQTEQGGYRGWHQGTVDYLV